MLDTQYLDEVPDSLVTEKANIDEILVYIAKEAHREELSESDAV